MRQLRSLGEREFVIVPEFQIFACCWLYDWNTRQTKKENSQGLSPAADFERRVRV